MFKTEAKPVRRVDNTRSQSARAATIERKQQRLAKRFIVGGAK